MNDVSFVLEKFNPFAHTQKKEMNIDEDDCVLSISSGNMKLKNIPYISLPAAYSCPFASACKSKVIIDEEGKKRIVDYGDYRCFSTQAEVYIPQVYANRHRNFDLLKVMKTSDEMFELINKSLIHYKQTKGTFKVFRIHSDGDFFNQLYFDAWLKVAEINPSTIYYAYTKSLIYWIKRKDSIPANLKLIASYGGRMDDLIEKENLRHCIVVKSVEEAIEKELHIDVDDSLAFDTDINFALLLHGSQPKGSGLYDYVKKNKQIMNKYR